MSTKLKDQNIYIEKIKNIVLSMLKDCDVSVYLFGSRAKNTAHRSSDVDIALLPRTKLPPFLVAKILETLEESNIPYVVDIVDLSHSDEIFKNKVITEGVKWKE